MVDIHRMRVELSGFNGGPGVNTFYSLDAPAAMEHIQELYTNLAPGLPTLMHMQVVSAGDVINPVNGELTGGWVGDPQTEIIGADSAAYPAPAGACIRWRTSTVVDGHRLQGRTFLVPLGGGSYQSDGSINPTNVANITSAAIQLLADLADNLVIWHRPRKAKAADGSRPAVTARNGSYALVDTGFCVDKTVVLRSRRA